MMIANMHKDGPQGWQRAYMAREPDGAHQNYLKTRYTTIGLILALALFSFEAFNFDTTQYALTDLMGDVRFAGVKWATILAIAFCGIDFAGLLRVFTPDEGDDTPSEVWYLMAAWLLGATMNAVMTWYAMSLTLSQHHIGNEILSQAQLMRFVPIFVSFLVWLTRILFIGSLTMAGNRIVDVAFRPKQTAQHAHPAQHPQQATVRVAPQGYRSHRPVHEDETVMADSAEIAFVPPVNSRNVRQHARH